jgi:hypothetical protein
MKPKYVQRNILDRRTLLSKTEVKKTISTTRESCSIDAALTTSPSARSWPLPVSRTAGSTAISRVRALYAEVLECFFTDPTWESCWEGVHVDLSSTDVGPQVVDAYLSRQHFEDIENSCPMVALPSDVARSGEGAKQAFETVFKAMVSVLERSLTDKKPPRRAKARAIAALCVGGMVVARSVVDRTLADDLRKA